MFAILLLLGCLHACSAASPPRWHELHGYTFEKFIADFNKSYGEKETVWRRALFQRELMEVVRHNKMAEATWRAGINKFSDWTEGEKKALRGYNAAAGQAARGGAVAELVQSIKNPQRPASVDWRKASPPILTSVKDQGGCGSCWTFAAAETIESAWALQTGDLQDLSEQQIASCAKNPRHCGGTGGCEGGTAQIAYQHVIDAGGIASEWVYPYSSYDGQDHTCAMPKRFAASLSGFVNVKSNNEDALMDAVAKGPVAVSVDANAWPRYESGIFTGCNDTDPDIDHAVVAVGYGLDDESGQEYWIIRNSWSPSWGEKGYIRLQKGSGTCAWDTKPQDGSGCEGGPPRVYTCGACAVLYDTTYPIVNASKL